MENLKEKLEKTLEEHQRESGLHMIGGRERLGGTASESARSAGSFGGER
jgi:hypothetical protein